MKINLKLFVTPGCSTCAKVKLELINYFGNQNNINIKILDVSSLKDSRIVIVPALFVNDELYSYGEFDSFKLNDYIKNFKVR